MSEAGPSDGENAGKPAVRSALKGAKGKIVHFPSDPPKGGGGHGGGEVKRIIIEPEAHWRTAGTIIDDDFVRDGYRTLNHYNDETYRYEGSLHDLLQTAR